MNQIKIIVTFVRFDEKHARTSLVTLKIKTDIQCTEQTSVLLRKL